MSKRTDLIEEMKKNKTDFYEDRRRKMQKFLNLQFALQDERKDYFAEKRRYQNKINDLYKPLEEILNKATTPLTAHQLMDKLPDNELTQYEIAGFFRQSGNAYKYNIEHPTEKIKIACLDENNNIIEGTIRETNWTMPCKYSVKSCCDKKKKCRKKEDK